MSKPPANNPARRVSDERFTEGTPAREGFARRPSSKSRGNACHRGRCSAARTIVIDCPGGKLSHAREEMGPSCRGSIASEPTTPPTNPRAGMRLPIPSRKALSQGHRANQLLFRQTARMESCPTSGFRGPPQAPVGTHSREQSIMHARAWRAPRAARRGCLGRVLFAAGASTGTQPTSRHDSVAGLLRGRRATLRRQLSRRHHRTFQRAGRGGIKTLGPTARSAGSIPSATTQCSARPTTTWVKPKPRSSSSISPAQVFSAVSALDAARAVRRRSPTASNRTRVDRAVGTRQRPVIPGNFPDTLRRGAGLDRQQPGRANWRRRAAGRTLASQCRGDRAMHGARHSPPQRNPRSSRTVRCDFQDSSQYAVVARHCAAQPLVERLGRRRARPRISPASARSSRRCRPSQSRHARRRSVRPPAHRHRAGRAGTPHARRGQCRRRGATPVAEASYSGFTFGDAGVHRRGVSLGRSSIASGQRRTDKPTRARPRRGMGTTGALRANFARESISPSPSSSCAAGDATNAAAARSPLANLSSATHATDASATRLVPRSQA